MALTLIAVAGASSFFTGSRVFMRNQVLEIETTQAARTVVDAVVRDLRLGGACLPVTGDFMSMEGVDGGATDDITTRTGLVRADLSCVRSATPIDVVTPASGSSIQVESVEGFSSGMRAYIRGPTTGEFFNITSVDAQNNVLGRDTAFSVDYPGGSGVYGIDERRYYVEQWAAPWGDTPRLMMQVGDKEAQPFAIGVEEFNLTYQLRRNCPPCDVVTLPQNDDEWHLVEALFLNVTARSAQPRTDGTYYRRQVRVGVKPRNLLPQ